MKRSSSSGWEVRNRETTGNEPGTDALLDGAGDCPPDDVGGIDGYYDFLKAYNNPKHRNHKKIVAWSKEQRYRPFDMAWSNTLLKMIKIRKTDWEALGLGGGHFQLTGRELDKYR